MEFVLKDNNKIISSAKTINELSDGYHTFKELYDFRREYNAALVNTRVWKAHKSYRHHDGELCFGGGWFIDYLNGEKLVAYKEVLTKEDDEFNYLMLNLRLIKGFSLNEFKNRYKKDFLKEYRKEIEKIKDSVVVENDYFRVKSDKIFILDSLLVDLLHFKD